jgi:UDP-N-acetyl-D-mannosaminuronic acid dehydrogenase
MQNSVSPQSTNSPRDLFIFGHGENGLATAVMFANAGIHVTASGMENTAFHMIANPAPGNESSEFAQKLEHAMSSGKLIFSQTVTQADVFIIAIPSPLIQKDDNPASQNPTRLDFSYLLSTAKSINHKLRKGNMVIIETICPPRTTIDLLQPVLELSGLLAGPDFSLLYSPLKLPAGKFMPYMIQDDRLIGGIDQDSIQAGVHFYRAFVRGRMIETDATTAELVRLMQLCYIDISLAVLNEFSCLAERFGVNIWDAVSLSDLHPLVYIPRPGSDVRDPSQAMEPWLLANSAKDITGLVQAAWHINSQLPNHIVELVELGLGNLAGRKIAALGLIYNHNQDDLTHNLALQSIRKLQNAGAQVLVYEPGPLPSQPKDVTIVTDLNTALRDADAILLLVDHPEIRRLAPCDFASLTTATVVIDTINTRSADEWKTAGFKLLRFGVGREEPSESSQSYLHAMNLFFSKPAR